METAVLGWPPDGPTLRLDYRRFSYAGKFVMSNTGKAVVRADGEDTASEREGGATGDGARAAAAAGVDGWDDDVLAAVAFNADRTDPATLWLRYVTVREDRRGEGLGPRLCATVCERAADRGYERVRIGVNNPFAYEACYRAGFAFTGEETGIAELVLERPAGAAAADRATERYQDGLDRFRERDRSDAEAAFVERKAGTGPPEPLAAVE
jgi:GNAT superfamily N-acetyltransferase